MKKTKEGGKEGGKESRREDKKDEKKVKKKREKGGRGQRYRGIKKGNLWNVKLGAGVINSVLN